MGSGAADRRKAFGAEARVKTHSPMFYVHWELQPGAVGGLRRSIPSARPIVQGRVERRHEYAAGQMLIFAPGRASPSRLEPST